MLRCVMYLPCPWGYSQQGACIQVPLQVTRVVTRGDTRHQSVRCTLNSNDVELLTYATSKYPCSVLRNIRPSVLKADAWLMQSVCRVIPGLDRSKAMVLWGVLGMSQSERMLIKDLVINCLLYCPSRITQDSLLLSLMKIARIRVLISS